jgi:hypothetical protein
VIDFTAAFHRTPQIQLCGSQIGGLMEILDYCYMISYEVLFHYTLQETENWCINGSPCCDTPSNCKQKFILVEEGNKQKYLYLFFQGLNM